jgi:two-component system chemotaxis response regulator CheB
LAIEQSLINRYKQTDILLLGGSAGSFKLMFRAIKAFPAKLGKAVIIILHRKKNYSSDIEKLFAENSRMSMREVKDKDFISKDMVYIAPANYHTLIERNGVFGLDVSEAVWYSKPSIDVTFESAANTYGKRCTAILFSGANQDGAEGLLSLRESGALTIAQHPEDAEMAEMPNSAIQINAAAYILRNQEIFDLLQS